MLSGASDIGKRQKHGIFLLNFVGLQIGDADWPIPIFFLVPDCIRHAAIKESK
jgi:hypothetical protein